MTRANELIETVLSGDHGDLCELSDAIKQGRAKLAAQRKAEREKKEKEKEKQAAKADKQLLKWVDAAKKAAVKLEKIPGWIQKHNKTSNHNTEWFDKQRELEMDLKRAKSTLKQAKQALKKHPDLLKKAGLTEAGSLGFDTEQLIERVMQGEDPARLLSEATGYVKASELLAAIEVQLAPHLKKSITKRQGNTGPARETARLIGKYRMLTGKFLVDVIKLFGDVPDYEITVEVATEEEKEFNEKGLTKQNMQSVAKKVAAFINSNISA